MQTQDIGEPRQLTSSWYNADGEGVEPSLITLTVTHPDGSIDSYTKAALTMGATTAEWYRWITPNANGLWRYTFVGTIDGFPVQQDGSFLVGEGSSSSPAGPCEPWTTWAEVAECGAPTNLTPAQQELAVDQASEILFNLSGRFYTGICETTRSLCFGCSICYPTCCDCGPAGSIDLGAPTWGAWDVYVDGVKLLPSAYKIVARRYLTRLDGQAWPSGWDVTDPYSFRATWAQGLPIPGGARRAAQQFAVEIAKSCGNDASCQLPKRVTNVVREGVTYTILDSMQYIKEGRTGLPMVDLWLVADREGRRGKPRIYHPAAPRVRKLP